MKLEYLREFAEAASSEQLNQAAQNLDLSMSTLSKHMKAVEKELDVPLFMRSRKVNLTQYGTVLLKYAQRVTQLQEAWEKEFSAPRECIAALTVGLPKHQHRSSINALLERCSRDGISCTVTEADNEQLAELVKNGMLDLAFIRSKPELRREEGLVYFPFTEERLLVGLPMSHPLAIRDSVLLPEVRDMPVFQQPENKMLWQLTEEQYTAAGLTLTRIACGAYGLHERVCSGKGITFYLSPPADSGAIAVLPVEPAAYTYVDAVVCRDHLPPAVIEFLREIRIP